MGSRSTTKLFVGNIKEDCRSSDLRVLFEKFGEVAECDIVKDYAFVHYYSADEAVVALEALDGSEFQGLNLRVQLSHSRVRPKPGMGERETCYRCGREGHWSKDCKAPGGGRVGGPPFRDAYRGHDDGYYSTPGGRDYYLPVPSGGPPGASAPRERYHPYDRRPPASPPAPVPRPAAYPPRSDYAYHPDYYSSRSGYSDYYSNAEYGSSGYSVTRRDPPQTDALGRPPPEYYAHRLKDALYELVKDPKRVPATSYDEIRKGPATSSSGYY